MTSTQHTTPTFLEPFWMPFTANRSFKERPRLFVGAQGMYYQTEDGRQILDGIAGLWCVNAGHAQRPIIDAIQAQAGRLDFVSSFQMSHPAAFELARRLVALAPGNLDHVFFTNSGSEAVDTALKIARGYHRAKGDVARTLFIGRVKGYHGVGFGGVSVGGIGRHKLDFGPLLPDVDHLSLPYDFQRSAFSRGQPAQGADYANELLSLITLHGSARIAAVIIEPVVGSGGVYPPPMGYLAKLRDLCTQHGILLIFDEVITGFGRLGKPFAAEAFDVAPDILVCAKAMTNGAVPMGAALVSGAVYEAFMDRPKTQIELSHGYTYSAHPLACAAALATLDVYREEDLFQRATQVAPLWESAVHALKDHPHVVDIRSIGLLAAIELEPRIEAPGARGAELNQVCFDAGFLVRNAGDVILLSPPLIISSNEIEQLVNAIGTALKTTS
jgi:beta-alanine--pyruvate transaminase